MSEINRYEIVHMIIKIAEKRQIESRNPLKNADYTSTTKKKNERINFVKEAEDEVLSTLKLSNNDTI